MAKKRKTRPAARPELISPTTAMKWLDTMRENRKISESLVQSIARDIKAGKWELNGDPIRFDHHNRLMDGQHRLWAIVEANQSVESYVVHDLHPKVMHTIDVGKRRSFANHLEITGHKAYSTCCAAVCRLLWNEDDGVPSRSTDSRGRLKPTQAELALIYRKHPDITASAEATTMSPFLCSHSILAYCHYKFSKLNKTQANDWAHAVGTGENLKTNDPCLHLRNRLVQNKSALRKMGTTELLALCFKSWNFRRNGRLCKVLRWIPKEGLPLIK